MSKLIDELEAILTFLFQNCFHLLIVIDNETRTVNFLFLNE